MNFKYNVDDVANLPCLKNKGCCKTLIRSPDKNILDWHGNELTVVMYATAYNAINVTLFSIHK